MLLTHLRSFLPVFTLAAILLSPFLGCSPESGNQITNVSYDPTRELYKEYNDLFVKHYKELKGIDVSVSQSHGGSVSQALNVVNGLRADVVTLALSSDIDNLSSKTNLLSKNWQTRLPNNSCPYTSTIVFLVRKDNPKNIRDWDHLVKPDIEVVTPDPKTSGGARWNYLAAWGFALKKELGDLAALKDPEKAEEVAAAQVKAREFVKALFKNVKTMDTGARGATVSFAERHIGDVLLAWENEALLYARERSEEGFEVVVPSMSILAEPPVALVDKNVDRYGSRDIAEEYLQFLYEPAAQEIIAKNFYRPSNPEVLAKYSDVFKPVEMITLGGVFGSWLEVQQQHFNDGAEFDRIIMENAGR